MGSVEVDVDVESDVISDDELAALALAADPDAEVEADAVSLWELDGNGDGALLPDWYMPGASGGLRPRKGWKRIVAIVVIVAFILINAYGLCSTYGPVELA